MIPKEATYHWAWLVDWTKDLLWSIIHITDIVDLSNFTWHFLSRWQLSFLFLKTKSVYYNDFSEDENKCLEEWVLFPNLPKSTVWAGGGPGDYIKVYLDSFNVIASLVTQVITFTLLMG